MQAAFAFAWGGVTGTGLGLGDPTRIPEAKNDFIFAAIGEELGLLGTTAIIVAYLLMIGAGLRIANRAERPFEKLLAAGLTTIIGVQAFVIIGGVTRVLPLTGVTLPFVSYGGSSSAGQLHPPRHPHAHLRQHGPAPRRGAAPKPPAQRPQRRAAGSDRRRSWSRVMNKQLRRLGLGLIVLLRRPVRAAQLAAGRQGRHATTTTRATTARPCATSPGRAARS